MNDKFDLNEALEQIKAGAKIDGKDGVLAPLIKQLTEAALEAELESHLGQEIRNRKNGKSSKRMKSAVGEFELEVPRDRNGTFEPQIVKKHQRNMSDQIEEKILSLYALGNSYKQISGHLEEIYGVSFSTASISAVTDKIIPLLKEWQQRPLEAIYPITRLKKTAATLPKPSTRSSASTWKAKKRSWDSTSLRVKGPTSAVGAD